MSRVNIRSKKKVVFSETPCVIWNDDPPVIPPPDLIQSRRNDCDEEEAGEEEEEEEEGEVLAITAKERRRRKVVTAVAFTTFVLLTASALFVLVTLFHASAIDEVVRKENEMQTYVFSNDNVTMMILNDNGEIQVNGTSLNDTST